MILMTTFGLLLRSMTSLYMGYCVVLVVMMTTFTDARAQSLSANVEQLAQEDPSIGFEKSFPYIHMQGLDKITGRTKTFTIPITETIKFGRLSISPRYCHQNPPEETPENTAFLEIDEHRLDGEKRRIFTGWMFASSPSLSALEHPVYDVWVLECRKEHTAENGAGVDGN